ncbi:MAG TPA: rhamnulokinase, partial [Bacteroidaceae bacterium]|nr:rhamnulokinase [Bacteroidaceae bacterium]
LHLIGGGSQSDYLNQKISSVCSRRVLSGPVEGAAIGNILVQAISEGVIRNLDEARQMVKNSFQIKEYNPQHPESELRYRTYKNLLTLNSHEKQ